MYLVITRMPGERYHIGDSGLCCCVCVTSFKRFKFIPLCVDSACDNSHIVFIVCPFRTPQK